VFLRTGEPCRGRPAHLAFLALVVVNLVKDGVQALGTVLCGGFFLRLRIFGPQASPVLVRAILPA